MGRWKKSLIIAGTALAVMLAYFGVAAWRGYRAPRAAKTFQTWEELTKERTARVLYWASQPSVLLKSTELDQAVADVLASEDCIAAPRNAQLVRVSQLTAAQRSDLGLAIAGFLKAYARNDPVAVYDYMESRHEVLPAEELPEIRNALVSEQGMGRSSVDAMDQRALFSADWKMLLHADPHWASLALHSGCVSVWRTGVAPDPRVPTSLGQEDNAVFTNIVTHRHNFVPRADSMESRVAKDGFLLMADVKLVIKYDDELLQVPTPHYVRFWYDPGTQVWHPHQLALIVTDSGQSYPKFLF
jgi:hypothetical protein